MKVALVHDYFKEFGGAERVVEALHEIFPDAPIYTAYLNLKGLGPHADRISPPTGGWDIRTSWLQKIPFVGRLISPLRILAPAAFESFNLSEYDLVISSSGAYFAKAVISKPGSLHIGYIHTPPRYLYGYATAYDYKKHWWTRIGGEVINHFLRLWDFEISQRPDILVANSQNVSERIKKFYRRESVVIYPPVDLDQFKGVKKQSGDYFLALNRLVRGKGTEIIVEACSKLGFPLKVAGSGPELERLKSLAGSRVEFLGNVSDEERVRLLAGAKATIVASEDEDFGIVPVESMAAGTPVIAVAAGGFLETVIPGKTGEFCKKATVEDLMTALAKFDPTKYKQSLSLANARDKQSLRLRLKQSLNSRRLEYKVGDCRKQAEKFSKERFKKEILDLVKKNLKT